MTKLRYNFEFLDEYCKKNNVILFDEYCNKKINKDTKITGKCIKNECQNTFSKNFRNLVLYNGLCKNCISKLVVIQRKETCINNYGCENPQQNKTIQEKTKQTCFLKYGCENPGQNEEIKNKMKNTNLIKYNHFYPFQNEEIKKKIRETTIKNWGTEYVSQNEEIKNKTRQTCLEKYGVEHHNQNEDVMYKTSKNAYKLKEYTFPSNKMIEIQGYENFALDELIISEEIDESDIITGCKNVPAIWYNDETGKKHRHYVDIFIPSQNRCIEVKSLWTAEKKKDSIFLKQKAAKELGYKYSIWVYNNKKEKVNCYD